MHTLVHALCHCYSWTIMRNRFDFSVHLKSKTFQSFTVSVFSVLILFFAHFEIFGLFRCIVICCLAKFIEYTRDYSIIVCTSCVTDNNIKCLNMFGWKEKVSFDLFLSSFVNGSYYYNWLDFFHNLIIASLLLFPHVRSFIRWKSVFIAIVEA